MKLQILGPGCAKCHTLSASAEQAAQALGLSCEIEKITDLNRIRALGVMLTPALVVDGQVKLSGKVPGVAELKVILQAAAGAAQPQELP